MGLQVTARLLCDKCEVSNVNLDSVDSPVPDAWLKAQGYANISGGASVSIIGYYCSTCITANGTKDLVKNAVDLADGLTPHP